jgi:hypothetical protein
MNTDDNKRRRSSRVSLQFLERRAISLTRKDGNVFQKIGIAGPLISVSLI